MKIPSTLEDQIQIYNQDFYNISEIEINMNFFHSK